MKTNFDRKLIVKFLDTAASRADIIDREPATGKQCWLLAGLIAQNEDQATYDEIVLNTSLVLTKRRASQMIDVYLS